MYSKNSFQRRRVLDLQGAVLDASTWTDGIVEVARVHGVSWAICVSSAIRIGVQREGLDCVGIGFDRVAMRVDRKDSSWRRQGSAWSAHRGRHVVECHKHNSRAQCVPVAGVLPAILTTVPDSKSQQKTLMVYFCLKSIINTTLNFTKSESWPTLKLGFIPQKVCQSTPFTLVNSMLVSKSMEAI